MAIDLSQFTTDAQNVLAAVKTLGRMNLKAAWADLETAYGDPTKAATDGADATVMRDVGEVLERIAPFIPVASAPLAIAGDALEAGAAIEPDIAKGAELLAAFTGGTLADNAGEQQSEIAADRFGR